MSLGLRRFENMGCGDVPFLHRLEGNYLFEEVALDHGDYQLATMRSVTVQT